MVPTRIRLVDLKKQTVDWHKVDGLPWNKVWTISHVWDGGDKMTKIPIEGVFWESNSFSSIHRATLMLQKTRQIVEIHGAEYVWIDAACIDQSKSEAADLERKEQVPFMGTIYGSTAGCVAFGKQTAEDRFVEITSTYNNGQKAWVCDWFERVWTFQELQLPKVLSFVSGDHVLTRDEVYLSLLMTSPYLTSPHISPPAHPNDSLTSTQDVVNTLSPLSRSNAQRSLMEASKRGCSLHYINDKVYGILGVLPELYKKLVVDYKIPLEQAALNFMKLMPPNDVLDTLTFNTLSPVDKIHDSVHWSGMVRLDGAPTEHPSYERDIHSTTNAHVIVAGNPPLPTTQVHDAPLWKVVVAKPSDVHANVVETNIRAWPSITSLSKLAYLTDDFSKVERSADYANAVGRAERSLAANWKLVKPLLEKAVSVGIGGQELVSLVQHPPTRTGPDGIPPNRLGDPSLFDKEVTMLHCRSKEDKSFHYGIVVTRNEDDGSWHKVCTAAFADKCVVARDHVEKLVVIGK